MKRPIIIDTDPGIDDVVAITAALFSDKLDVKLITTVGGNVGIENTTRNAVDLVTFLGKNTPIAKGASEPLLNKPNLHHKYMETAVKANNDLKQPQHAFTIR